MNFLKIAGKDISGIFKNRFIRVSVVAIIVVPILYSLMYLAAFWDPYSKLSEMPVAIVNEDLGSTKDGKKVNFGNDLVDKLKDNDKVGWRFVNKEEAEKGLKGKNYYSMFVIPKTFSEDALSSTKGKPKQPIIVYSANEKRNFLAAQISNKVHDELKAEITKNMSKEYSVEVFDKLYEVKDGMEKAADGSKKLSDGLVTAYDGTGKLNDGLNELNKKVPEMKDGVAKLTNGSNTLTTKLGELKGKVPAMVDGAAKLTDGVNKLYDGSDKLKNGLGQLKSNLPAMSEGVAKLEGGSKQLNDGLGQLNGQIPTLSGGMSKLYDGFKNKILPSTEKLKDGSAQLAKGLGAAKDGAAQLSDAATKLSQGSAGLTDGAAKLNDGSKQMDAGIKSLKDATAQVATGVDALIAKANESQVAMQKAVQTQLGAYLKANPKAMEDNNMKQFVATLTAMQTSAADTKNAAMIKALQEGAHKTADGAAKLSEGAKAFTAGSQKFAESTIAYAKGADQFAKGASTFAEKTGAAIGGATQISSGLEQLYAAMNGEFGIGFTLINSKMPALTEGVGNLADGSKALAGGMNQFGQKLPTLTEGVNKLADGSVALNGGLGTLKSKIPALQDGVKKLQDGAPKLHDGSAKISEGLNKLNEKVPQLQDGVSKLADGSNKLYDGTLKLKDGSKELSDKLNDGYIEMNDNLKNNSETMGNVVSEPVIIAQKPLNPVGNYGTGFTPYFIPLSLWVGAIMMFFVISDKVADGIQASSASLVAGKFLSFGFIGLLQAVFISIVVLMLGLKPVNVPLYFLTNIFLSYVFIAIIQCLIFLLGDAGRLIAIAALILQLTSCAGTFPLEVVPKFFKVANPYMPFTYAVSALREAISGVDYSVFSKDITVLAGMLFGFLFISMLMKGHADKVQQRIQEKKEGVITA